MKLTYIPAAYITHSKGEYNITIELPGVKKENINLEITEQGFCLNAKGTNFRYSGCWALAHKVNPKDVEAKFKNGLLTIKVGLKKPPEGRKIKIK
ncbi:MAG: Hsp20/alpha crystallin family protein [Methanobacteriaceae archaeon]|nr:Hsp20/alpha crystallin family protein [Methanobacteriaceae archaeon]